MLLKCLARRETKTLTGSCLVVLEKRNAKAKMAEPVKVKVEDADSEVENHETEETEPEKEESDEKADTNKKPDSNEERSVALDLDQSSEHEEPAGAEPQEETLDEIKRDLKEEKEQVSTVIPEFGLKNWNSLVQMS